jgi:predicted glycosyltransferase
MTRGPVWIDLANSPHVLFFQPVIDELHRRGVETTVSARDFAQTVELCRLLGIDAEVVGRHGGASLAGKVTNLAGRVRALRAFARKHHPTVAVSHNSYAQALAGRSLGIPVVTAMDYEFQPANHLAFRCAKLVVVPDVFPLDVLRRQGARLDRTWRYPGLKEEIALAGFVPDPEYLRHSGIDDTQSVVVVRPPAHMALYHRFENPLFGALLERLERLRRDGQALVVLLPRTPTQAASLDSEGFGALLWRDKPLDGRQLIAGADAVISAGGSMNREAAVLGTPAYSVYAGRLAAVDRALVAEGKLTLLRSAQDVATLELAKKPVTPPPRIHDGLLMRFVDKLQETMRG